MGRRTTRMFAAQILIFAESHYRVNA